MATTRAHDCFVVESAPLSALLRTFVAIWERDRPRTTAGQFEGEWGADDTRQSPPRRDASPVSAVRYLAEQSGVPVQTVSKLTMARPPSPTTRLDTADALVTVLGCPEAFHDGTLTILRRVHGQLVPADSLTGAAEF